MAKYRAIQTSFWEDVRVVEEFTPEDKFFYLYLLTNPRVTQIGIYEISKKQMAFDLGYAPEAVKSLLARFIDHHKLILYNDETRELAIKNWGKHNFTKGGKPIEDCVISELSEIKDHGLIEYVGENVENAKIKALYDTYHDTSRFGGQKEKEKEKEKGTFVPAEDDDVRDVESISVWRLIHDRWNSLDNNIPKIQAIKTGTMRHRLLKARINEYGDEAVLEAIDKIRGSRFLCGYATDFVITFDWFIKPNNFIKVYEGNYADKPTTHPPNGEAAYYDQLREWATS